MYSAEEKIELAAAAGVSTPIDGPLGYAAALGEGFSGTISGTTGLLQGTAAITGSRGIADASGVVSIFGSVSGPITLAVTGSTEKASTASTIEALFFFGFTGAISDVGVSNILDATANATDLVSPIQKPPGCN